MLPFGETEIEVLERYRISLNNTGSQPGIAEIIDEFGYGRESLRKPGQDWTTPSQPTIERCFSNMDSRRIMSGNAKKYRIDSSSSMR